ncbi:hypothetical protein HanRHA438_Chr09g0428051 [Helianthus annuus]|nr:hypothetical protein HanLR1_Chr09g0341911 [Helianthus annuus]KAJ0713449.1 hypothetical protein HanOQP8_Chr09g0345991 [Helianthus annuus]KAJ0890818.1 hypothetical protein HanRHA438_Chr09g0428051 [Helianthus annuus]
MEHGTCNALHDKEKHIQKKTTARSQHDDETQQDRQKSLKKPNAPSPLSQFPRTLRVQLQQHPVYPLSLFTTHKKHHKQHKKTSHNKSTIVNNEHDHIFVDPAVIKALEMMLTSAAASPVVPGFGKSPMVRQLRVTDSPFPLSNEEEDSHVDEAAEKFIMKFYNELRRQS